MVVVGNAARDAKSDGQRRAPRRLPPLEFA